MTTFPMSHANACDMGNVYSQTFCALTRNLAIAYRLRISCAHKVTPVSRSPKITFKDHFKQYVANSAG